MSVLDDLSKEEAKMDMTPMIDVVFQLIIFFMCNIKYKTLEGRLDAYLPRDVGVNSSPASAPIERVEITLKVLEVGERRDPQDVGSSRVDLQACKLEYSIVSPK